MRHTRATSRPRPTKRFLAATCRPQLPEVDRSQHFAVDLELEDVRPSVVPRHVKRPLRGRRYHRVALRVEDAVLLVQRARHDPSARTHDHRVSGVVSLLEIREHLRALRKIPRDVLSPHRCAVPTY